MNNTTKKVLLLGSTGSIGENVLKIISLHKDKFRVVGLSTKSNINLLSRQIKNFSPEYVCIVDEKYKSISQEQKISQINKSTKVLYGEKGLIEIINLTKPDILVNAVVGIVGLKPLLYAIENNIEKVAVANKESIVVGGEIVFKKIKNSKTKIIPVDSEHSSIFQCLKNEQDKAISRVILTASGGPLFKQYNIPKNVERIIKHPVWKMGKKISVDSATMVNKGFEYIEAHYLFNLPYEKIEIVIHPESLFHSFVEFVDGAILALIAIPDMRVPISYALGFPQRLYTNVKRVDILQLNKINFFPPDYKKFPLLKLLMDCAKTAVSYIVAFNSANEIVVQKFIEKKIKFEDIARIIKKVIDSHKPVKISSIDDILELDKKTRNITEKFLS